MTFSEAIQVGVQKCPQVTGRTRVVNVRTARYDVYIGRAQGVRGRWGNPFVMGRDGTREQVIAKYRIWLQRQPHLLAALPSLHGKVLGCFCAPQACHGDVLAAFADAAGEQQKSEVVDGN